MKKLKNQYNIIKPNNISNIKIFFLLFINIIIFDI